MTIVKRRCCSSWLTSQKRFGKLVYCQGPIRIVVASHLWLLYSNRKAAFVCHVVTLSVVRFTTFFAMHHLPGIFSWNRSWYMLPCLAWTHKMMQKLKRAANFSTSLSYFHEYQIILRNLNRKEIKNTILEVFDLTSKHRWNFQNWWTWILWP